MSTTLDATVEEAIKDGIDATFLASINVLERTADLEKLLVYVGNYVRHQGHIVTNQDIKDVFYKPTVNFGAESFRKKNFYRLFTQ